MYILFKSLYKRKSEFILAIIQLSLGLTLLNYVNILINNNTSKLNSLDNIYNISNTYITRTISSENSNYGNLKDVIDDLDELKKSGVITNYITQFSYPFSKIESLEKALFNDSLPNHEQTDAFYAPITLIDLNFFKKTDINVISGRTLTSDDFQKNYTKDTIPIWLGKDYKDLVNIGEIFETTGFQDGNNNIMTSEKITFEIAGILDNHQLPTIHGKINVKSQLTYTDKLILIPTVPNFFEYSSEVALNDFGLFVELPSIDYFVQYNNTMEQISQKYNFEYSTKYLKDELSVKVENLTRELYQSSIVGCILVFLSLIGILSVFLNNLSSRKDEFIIKLITGASLKILLKEIIFEIILIVSSSIILSLFFLFIKNGAIPNIATLLFQNLILIFIISSVFSIIIYFKFKKMMIK